MATNSQRITALEALTKQHTQQIAALDARVDALEAAPTPEPPEPEPPEPEPPQPEPPTGTFPATVNPLTYQALVPGPLPPYLGVHVCNGHQSAPTELKRVSNGVRVGYSSLNVFNADDTLMLLTRGGSGPRVLRVGDFADLASASGLSIGFFSEYDPAIAFGRSSANEMRMVRVASTGACSTVQTYGWPSRPSGGSYSSLSWGGDQGVCSGNGRWWSYFWTAGSDWGIGVWDREQNKVYAERKLGTGSSPVDNSGMSHSGDWMMWSASESVGAGTGTTQGTWIYSRDLSTMWQPRTKQEHWDWAKAADGSDRLVMWTGSGYMSYDPNTKTGINIGPTSSTPGDTHISGRAHKLPGWVYVSVNDVGGTTPGRNQIIAVKIDGSKDVRVFCFDHCTVSRTYENFEFACPSSNGEMVAFGGPWEGGSPYGYVARKKF
jgi:hypothetical protein